jgi:predicted TIM-barrel fold metal-dependent hydrolase
MGLTGIFDIHVHIFPDKIAEKAARNVSRFYDIPMRCDGKLSTALREFDRAGIGRFCAHSVATSPAQMKAINDFIWDSHAKYPDRILPFAALHPDVPDVAAAVDEIVRAGFRGVKIHPDIQGFRLDDAHVLNMIGAVAGRLPLLIHTGDHRYDNSGPERMKNVLDRFPRLMAICAHLGGWSEWDKVIHAGLPGGKNLYVDTSSALYALPPAQATEIIRAYGADHVFFGTDYPMWSPAEEIARFDALGLDEAEREKILCKNAVRFFGL